MTKSAPQATDKVLPPWDGLRDFPRPRVQVQKTCSGALHGIALEFGFTDMIITVTSGIKTIAFYKNQIKVKTSMFTIC